MAAIIIFAILIVIVVLALVIAETNRKKRARCKECDTKYDYDNDVSWSVVQEIEEQNCIKSVVDITCVCHNCGAEKKYTRTFKTAERNTNTGVVTRRNIYDLLKKEFK